MNRRAGRLRWLWPGVLAAFVLGLALLPPCPEPWSHDLRAGSSLQLTDRQGRPLRTLLSAREGVNAWIPLSEIAPELVNAVLMAEDRRFRWHLGVDPLAAGRAAYQNWRAGRIVSGASTLTQQLLRTFEPDSARGWSAKLQDLYWAWRCELRWSKDDLLEAYLNRVAMGPGLYGVEEAARAYFGKSARSVSLAESLLLAVLIRSPSGFDPWSEHGQKELRRWTDQLLSRLQQEGWVSSESAERARRESWQFQDSPPPFLAPHFCDLVLSRWPDLRGRQATSLDLELQQQIEGMVSNHLRLLAERQVDNAAVLVAEVESGEVLALVGSADYHRAGDGQHNAALSLRQPGSTLKPFTYARLLEKVGHAGYLLPDLPIYDARTGGGFLPDNYDGRFRGPVSVRAALASSWNVPAVKALEEVGVETLLLTLRHLGLEDLTRPPGHYGLGLTLGDGSASLWQLLHAYRALARQGLAGPLSLRHPQSEPTGQRVLPAEASQLITDILADRTARLPGFGSPNVLEFSFPVAVKTGTSKGYRDNWCLGYTPRHVVGVWVGNSDGRPMQGVSGISGAGPLFRDVMLALGDGGDFPPLQLPVERLCGWSGQRAQPWCPRATFEPLLPGAHLSACQVCRQSQGRPGILLAFEPLYQAWARQAGLPLVPSTPASRDAFRVIAPKRHEVFLWDPDLPAGRQKVRVRTAGGKAPFRWWVDGRSLPNTESAETWWPLELGRHDIRVQDATGQSDTLHLEVRSGAAVSVADRGNGTSSQADP